MELATPITIYWDLPPQTTDIGYLLRICADIMACRPLMLNLNAPSPGIGEGTAAVLNRLAGSPVAVSLTIPAADFGGAATGLCTGTGVKEILLSVDHPEDLSRSLHGRIGGGTGKAPDAAPLTLGVSFPVTRKNWQRLPDLLTRCRREGVARLVLPMQRLYSNETPFLLNREEQDALAGSLAAAGGPDGMTITIHDPFIWRAFHPGVPFPQGGCQAGNTMLAVAPDGGVYPCPALPVLLGRIGEMSLREIVASSVKKEVRRTLLQNPADCRECGELAACRGGCRGRSYVVHGSLDGADPACA